MPQKELPQWLKEYQQRYPVETPQEKQNREMKEEIARLKEEVKKLKHI